MTVDSHVHLLAPGIAERVRSLFDQWLPGKIVYPPDHRGALARLMAAGIDEVWTLPYAHRPGVASWMNEASAATRDELAAADLAIVGGATVHPGDDDPVGILETAWHDHGLRVLKVHCAVGDFRLDDRRLDPVWAWCAERGVPTVAHLGKSPLGDTDDVDVPELRRVADRHPDTTIVVAHAGHPATEATLRVLTDHPNLYADLTPVVDELVTVPPWAVDALGDRFLTGTDAPNAAVDATAVLSSVRHQFGADPDRLAAVLGDTARRLVPATP